MLASRVIGTGTVPDCMACAIAFQDTGYCGGGSACACESDDYVTRTCTGRPSRRLSVLMEYFVSTCLQMILYIGHIQESKLNNFFILNTAIKKSQLSFAVVPSYNSGYELHNFRRI